MAASGTPGNIVQTWSRRAEPGRSPHVVGLDGARALAILLVMTCHDSLIFGGWLGVVPPPWLTRTGFFGVELFFVLSGLLIGRLLIGLMEGDISLRAWWIFLVRRGLRTLPLYWAWLTVLSVVWPPHFWQAGEAWLRHDLPFYISMTQNLARPMVDAWFAVSWSLGVEEWFYFLFATFLLAGVAAWGRSWFWVAAALFLCVPLLLRWQLPSHINWDQVTTKVVLYRLDAITFGVVVAWIEHRRPAWLGRHLPLASAGLLLVLAVWMFGLDPMEPAVEQIRRTFVFDVASVGLALMLPWAASVRRLPRLAAALIGALSNHAYALYLVHLSIAEIAQFYCGSRSPLLAIAGTLAATALVAAAGHRWIERPIMRWRPSQPALAVPPALRHRAVMAHRRALHPPLL